MFPTFADKQTPRATVLTCADSRVQTTRVRCLPGERRFSWSATSVTRWDNSAGSIEYGIEQLGTPLLLVIGHTGLRPP